MLGITFALFLWTSQPRRRHINKWISTICYSYLQGHKEMCHREKEIIAFFFTTEVLTFRVSVVG